MPQISRPLLIALVAAVGFAAVWMTVLRPRAQEQSNDTAAASPAVTAPGAAGLGHAIKRAHGAASASVASDARTQQAAAQASSSGSPTKAGASAATPAASPAVVAATTAKRTPVPVASARAHPTVLLFAGKGADDAVARRVVRSVHRRGVRTVVTSIDHLARYRELTGGIQIESLPTILVIGTEHNARRIVGLPDRAQVVQALDWAGR